MCANAQIHQIKDEVDDYYAIYARLASPHKGSLIPQ